MPRLLQQWLTGVLTGHACTRQADQSPAYSATAPAPWCLVRPFTGMEQVRALRT